MSTETRLATLESQLLALQQRVAELEQGSPGGPVGSPPDLPPGTVDHGLLNRLKQRQGPGYEDGEVHGAVTYAGVHRNAGQELGWHSERGSALVLNVEGEGLTAVLSALSHPLRLDIVRLLLRTGAQDRSQIQDKIGLTSVGQLYHHLNQLLESGLINHSRRGIYLVPAENVVKLLALITAALDLSDSV